MKKQLGVPRDTTWREISQQVHVALTADWMQNLEVHIPNILAKGVPVLTYVGDLDVICNYEGNLRWSEEMDWGGQDEFQEQEFKNWILDGEKAGSVKAAGNYTFLTVRCPLHRNLSTLGISMIHALFRTDLLCFLSLFPGKRRWAYGSP